MEERCLLSDGLWLARLDGLPGDTREQQMEAAEDLLESHQITDDLVRVVDHSGINGIVIIQTPLDATVYDVQSELQGIPGFRYVQDYTPEEDGSPEDDGSTPTEEDDEGEEDELFDPPDSSVNLDPSQDLGGTNLNVGLSGNEPTIAVNPLNPNNIVIAQYNQGQETMKISLDGGTTFPIQRNAVRPTGQTVFQGDDSLAFDSQGRLFWTYLTGGTPAGPNVISLQVNPTTGAVIGSPSFVATSNLDKEWNAADANPSSPFANNLYVTWNDFKLSNAPVRFARSTDQGATWTTLPGNLSGAGEGFTWPSEVAVAPNGDVWVAWHTNNGATNGEVRMRRSTDGGLSFGPEIIPFPAGTAATTTNSATGLANKINGLHVWLQGSMQPRILIDPARPGNIYVVSVDDPNTFNVANDPSDVVIARSTDNGATWTRSTISQGLAGDSEFMPAAAIDANGNLAVTWYDNRRHLTVPDSLGGTHDLLDLFATTSFDGGLTFTPPVQVNDPGNPFDPERGAPDRFGNHTLRIGEYNGLAIAGGRALAVWTGNTATGQQIVFDRFDLGLAVTGSTPADGSVVSAPPSRYLIDFNSPVDPASLQASDLEVNGNPADGVMLSADQKEATFTFTVNPVGSQGLQTMEIAAGSITRDGDPSAGILAFHATFRYDAVPLQVTSTNPPTPGGVFTLPAPFTYDVNFNEPIDPSSVQASDLVLSGLAGASVTGVTVLNGNTTARFTIDGITAEGTLIASIAAGAIVDQYGNPGTSNFSGSYTVDIGTVPFPTPLNSEAPLGSLIYDASTSGLVNFPNDTDSFTIAVDPGQTITVVVNPGTGLDPTVSLADADGILASTATLGSDGRAVLQAVPTRPGAGTRTYTITIGGASGTTGAYSVQVLLNAAVEREGQPLANGSFETGNFNGWTVGNSGSAFRPWAVSPAGALSISGYGIVPTAPQDGSRDAWNGFDGTGPMQYTMYQDVLIPADGAGAQLTWQDRIQWNFLAPTPKARTLDVQVLDPATGAVFATVYSFSTGGVTGLHDTGWQTHTADLSAFRGHTVRLLFRESVPESSTGPGQIEFDDISLGSTAAISNDTTATAQDINATFLPLRPTPLSTADPAQADRGAVVGRIESGLAAPASDVYSFDLTAGQPVTIAATVLTGGGLAVQLLDPSGNPIVSGVGAANLDSVISNFVPTTSGTYYARVSGSTNTTYSLVVTRGAAFDTERNDTIASAQNLDGTDGVLGSLSASGATLTLNAIDSGWWDQTGSHNATNKNYVSGLLSGNEHRDFFVFDLSSVSQPITGAQLRLSNPTNGYMGPDPSETYALFDVSTPIGTLRASGSGQVGIFADLGTGTVYGSRVVSAADQGMIVSIDLDASAVSDLADAEGGLAAIGGALTTLSGTANQEFFAFTNASTGVRQLVLNVGRDEDWYAINVASTANILHLETRTPADGPGQFDNTLDPHIELYDPAGNLVASGDAGSDGRNESIAYQPLATGVYRVRVVGQTSSLGEYVLTKNFSPVLQDVAVTPTINENDVATLTGTIADPDTRDSFELVVNWGDGSDPETIAYPAGTSAFSLKHRYLDDNPTGTPSDVNAISLTVTDSHGARGVASTSLTVNNLAPVITAADSSAGTIGSAVEGQSVLVTASFTDVGTRDTHSARVNWGDGTITIMPSTRETGGSGTVTASHAYDQGGIYTITITVTDDDTGTSSVTTQAIITGAGVHNGQLQIVGTSGDDLVTINSVGRDTLRVHAGFLGSPFRDFSTAEVSQIVMLLGAGDDQATIAGNIATPALLDGGDGNDQLKSGGGPSILLGGPGDDKLIGGSGNNILVGGDGADQLVGGPGDDILIAGSTVFDGDISTLFAILDEWDQDQPVSLLSETTVFDDNSVDVLNGSSGANWFFDNPDVDRALNLRRSDRTTITRRKRS